MTSHLYLKLNNLFSDDNEINDIKTYLTNNTLPPRLDTNKKIKHFLVKFNKFKVENNKLYFEDPEHKLEVIPRADIPDTLKRLYDDQDFSTGSGQQSLYFKVRDRYLNIKRNDVAEFIKREPTYQMTRKPRHHINKPIRASQVNERWSCDHIDVGEDYKINNQRYILTVIDYFSRYAWCEPQRDRTADATVEAVRRIIQRAENTYPHIL